MDDKGLVERLKKYRGGDCEYRALMDEAVARIAALEGALMENATALNALVECIGDKYPISSSHRWGRHATSAEAQAALLANNNARALLTGGGRG